MAPYDSTVSCGNVDLDGTFDYTPPNPPTTPNGSLGGTYTLDNGTSLSMTNTATPGASVQFSIATGGQTYTFNGAYTSGTGEIVGQTAPCPSKKRDNDNWTASAQ